MATTLVPRPPEIGPLVGVLGQGRGLGTRIRKDPSLTGLLRVTLSIPLPQWHRQTAYVG